MKRIFLACFLLTATATVSVVQRAAAYAPATSVTNAAFMTKVNQMDAQLGAGNVTAAQATWLEIHTMELNVLATTKSSIQSAATPADRATYTAIMNNQYDIYKQIWELKPDLATNRAAIHAKLITFAATIY